MKEERHQEYGCSGYTELKKKGGTRARLKEGGAKRTEVYGSTQQKGKEEIQKTSHFEPQVVGGTLTLRDHPKVSARKSRDVNAKVGEDYGSCLLRHDLGS